MYFECEISNNEFTQGSFISQKLGHMTVNNYIEYKVFVNLINHYSE